MAERDFGLGLVGAGWFGRLCLGAYSKLPGLRLVAVCDSDPERLMSVAHEFGLTPYTDFAAMLADPGVDIVAVNTPPSSHASLSIAAARAGKHIFCEKPLATSLADAEAALRAAQASSVALGVDYVMRPNPLYRLLKRLASLQGSSGPVFGQLRRFALENFAADEKLGPGHWFWDEQQSGGIFVEHGVHFFDLFGWQLGASAAPVPQRVVALQRSRDDHDARVGARGVGVTDTAQAVVAYEGGATGSFYHTFARADEAEHQLITFGWDWATAELHGWIALDLAFDALVDEHGLATLGLLLERADEMLAVAGEPPLPGARLDWQVTEQFANRLGPGRTMRGRGKERQVAARVRIDATLGGQEAKWVVYEQCVRAGMSGLIEVARAAIRHNKDSEGTPAPIFAPIPIADLWVSTAIALTAREAARTKCEVAFPTMPIWLTDAANATTE